MQERNIEMEYTVPIQRTKIKKKHMTSMHLIAGFMAILIGAIILATPEHLVTKLAVLRTPMVAVTLILGLAFIAITIIANKKLAQKKNNTLLRSIEIITFAVLIAFCLLNTWWMHAVYGLVGLITISITYMLEMSAHKPEYIKVNKVGITMKKWTNKTIAWSEVKNFLIRHGNVTINLKNNTFYQFPAFQFTQIENKETIEAYAKQQIDSNAHKYQADW